jgi:chromosome segregation ATPase
VDTSAQNQRDSDRRRILDEEVKKEETRLADLKKEFNNGEPERRGDERNFEKYQSRVQKLREDIARTEGNIGSLRREIGLIKG